MNLQEISAAKRGLVTKVSGGKRLTSKAIAMTAEEFAAHRVWNDPTAPALDNLECSVNLALTEGPGADGQRKREAKLTFVAAFANAATTDGRRKPQVCYFHSENIGPVIQFLPKPVADAVIATWTDIYSRKAAEYGRASDLWLAGKDVPGAIDVP